MQQTANGKLKATAKRLTVLLSSWLMSFYRPVAQNPLLFVLVAVCCAAAPLAATLSGQRCLRLLVYALLSGTTLAWLTCCLPRKWLKVTALCLFMTIATVEALHYALLDKSLDANSLSLALNTNATEVRGFFVNFFSAKVVIALLAAVAAMVIAAFAVARTRLRLPAKNRIIAVALLGSVCAGIVCMLKPLSILGCRSYDNLIVWETQGSDNPELCMGKRAPMADPMSKAVYLWRSISLSRQNFRLWSERQRQIWATHPSAKTTEDSLQVVVVIGESFIRSHSSLYGYHLPVNPYLEREVRDSAIVVFTDAVAPANFTVLSLSNVLNLNSVTRGEKWWESVYIPLAFRKAGWDVELFTNQYTPAQPQDLGQIYFDALMCDSVYTRYNSRVYDYDGDFVASLPAPARTGKRTLTILQLMGQHFPPSLRVPTTSLHPFSADDIPADKPWLTPERRAVVADYANATLYNDSIIHCIIERYSELPTLLVYFSDHGEEMWDSAPFGNRNRQHPEDPSWMHRQYDVPLMVWLSPSLRAKRPELAERIRRASTRPVAMDQIGHALLGAVYTASPWYRAELDVLSDKYRPQPRKTAQGFPYPD